MLVAVQGWGRSVWMGTAAQTQAGGWWRQTGRGRWRGGGCRQRGWGKGLARRLTSEAAAEVVVGCRVMTPARGWCPSGGWEGGAGARAGLLP